MIRTNLIDKIAVDLCDNAYLDDMTKIKDNLDQYGAYNVELHALNTGMEFITCNINDDSWLAIRGTQGHQDIITDLDMSKMDFFLKKIIAKKKKGAQWFDEYQNEVKRIDKVRKEMKLKRIHFGFFKGAESIAKYVHKNNIRVTHLTGHSLGGGVAHILALFLRELESIITFGAPRSGGINFAKRYNKKYKKITRRFFNYMDIVPKVPLRIMFYMHVGTGLFFNKNGKLKKRIEQFRDLFNWCKKKKLSQIDIKDIFDKNTKNKLMNKHILDGRIQNGYIQNINKNMF